MNTMRLLIIITFSCLTAAVVYFYVSNDDDPSLEELKQQLYQARLQQQTQNDIVSLPDALPAPPINLPTPTIAPEPAPAPEPQLTPEEIQRRADEAERKILADAKAREEAEKNRIREEAYKRLDNTSKDRQWIIKHAPLLATVREYNSSNQILAINLMPNSNVAAGQILGIRKRNGILGRIKVARVENEQLAFADPVPGSFFGGNIDINVGDELILVP